GRDHQRLGFLHQGPPAYAPAFWNSHAPWALIRLVRNGDAPALIERYLHDEPGDRGGLMTILRAVVSAKRGDARRAEADIQSAIEKGRGFVHFHHTEYNIAAAYALLRQPRASVEGLRRAAAEGWPCC